jgi:hypothetical protein
MESIFSPPPPGPHSSYDGLRTDSESRGDGEVKTATAAGVLITPVVVEQPPRTRNFHVRNFLQKKHKKSPRQLALVVGFVTLCVNPANRRPDYRIAN